MYIGIAAHSEEPNEAISEKARIFLEELSRHCSEARLVLGGYWGLMKLVADEALRRGFTVVIVPPVEMEDVEYPEKAIVIKTGSSFRVRSVFLVRTSDVLVVLGGGAGCIQELVTAYTERKPVLLLTSTGYPTDFVEAWPAYLDNRMLAPIIKVRDPRELARRACEEARKKSSRRPAISRGDYR
ncbi:MAG: LOG family protein [Desulfurococcaceae archaeon]|jgi:uncharacterized protein (TIGR00725 family)